MSVYLGALQLAFALTWTVYVIYLPALAVEAGLDKRWVPWILLLDQLIFALCDWAVGRAADKSGATLGRVGHLAALATLVSCGAFIVLPWVAPGGAVALLAATLVWTITSSALRAPPFALIGRHVPPARQPWLTAASLFGLGLAGAVGPYLTLTLKGVDPKLPFAISSVVLALLTLGLARAERALARLPKPDVTEDHSLGRPAMQPFLIAALLAGLAFQIHFPFNAAPQFQRVAAASELPQLMPLFWVGFNLMVLPASLWATRFGAVQVMAAGAIVGAIASAGVAMAFTLTIMAALQVLAGAAWGVLLMSAFAGALAARHTGAEGRVTGAMFSLFALAALTRIGIVATQIEINANIRVVLNYAPAMLWGLAAAVLWRTALGGPGRSAHDAK
jgi:MFS family permease